MTRPARAPCAERKSLRLAAVQMIFADSIAGNLAKIEHAATQAAADGADAVLFPECATTSYAFDFEAEDIRRISGTQRYETEAD